MTDIYVLYRIYYDEQIVMGVFRDLPPAQLAGETASSEVDKHHSIIIEELELDRWLANPFGDDRRKSWLLNREENTWSVDSRGLR